MLVGAFVSPSCVSQSTWRPSTMHVTCSSILPNRLVPRASRVSTKPNRERDGESRDEDRKEVRGAHTGRFPTTVPDCGWRNSVDVIHVSKRRRHRDLLSLSHTFRRFSLRDRSSRTGNDSRPFLWALRPFSYSWSCGRDWRVHSNLGTIMRWQHRGAMVATLVWSLLASATVVFSLAYLGPWWLPP